MKPTRLILAEFSLGASACAVAALLWAGCASGRQVQYCKPGPAAPASIQQQADMSSSTVRAEARKLAGKVQVLNSDEQIEITREPADQQVEVGDTATFFVEAKPDAINYQWYKIENGKTNELPNAVTEIFTTEPIKANEAALYQCRLSNDFGEEWTRQAALTVVPKGFKTLALQAVYGAYRPGAGTKGNCPGNYLGTVTLTAANGSKWFKSTKVGPITATATYGATPVRIEITELQRMAVSCGLGSAIFSDGKANNLYQFIAYFGSPAPPAGASILFKINWP